MNIFVLDLDPVKSAQSLVNKHIVKMVLESTYLLCLAHNICGGPEKPVYFYKGKGYKNHPCSIWARKSIQNYMWLAEHNCSLCEEYTFRYGKIHKVQREGLSNWLFNNIPNVPNLGLTAFAEATGDIHEKNIVETYRKYYIEKKSHLFVWSKRGPPNWIPKEKIK